MNSQLYASLATVFLIVCFSDAHPAFQHQFHRVLNEQPCLKKCFDAVAEADLELNFLKVANISGYLLNLDKICDIISSSKECISSCGEKSNPFMLRSMTAMCTPEVHAEVQSIAQCLYDEGDEIFDACRNSCGDYEAINSQVSDLTQAMRNSPNDPAKTTEIMTKTNEACATLKCSDRCSIGLYREQCTTSDGRDAGTIIRSLIERVLVAQRHDLDSMQLADTMAQTMPAQCNYMYMPEVMFNSTKDELAQLAIDDAIRQEKSQKAAELAKHAEKAAHDEVPLTLTQIQARILRKQLQLLDIQEKNAFREAKKLDMEMELLRNKQISF